MNSIDLYKKFIGEYDEISNLLTLPEISLNPKKLKELSQRHSDLTEIVEIINEIKKKEKEVDENNELIEGNDDELREMAIEENEKNQNDLLKLKQKFEYLTIPRDPHDKRDCILEVRAGAGGDEAGLFGAELIRAYGKFVEKKGLKMILISSNKNESGGVKEVVMEINGNGAFGIFKHEFGVHRVQRIPETEKNGRVHTSTVTVAVLPKAEEEDIIIKPEEVKIDTYRSSGPGGQSVNTTDSAIRLTHIPSGLMVTCQDEKSQHKNKAKAFSILRSRLLQHKREEEQKKIDSLRNSQIGTGDRSEKIRTYNYPQDRVTDHRIKQNWHGILAIMEGEMDEIFNDLKKAELQKLKENVH